MKRIEFLDNLRSAIILLVIVFHAAMAYMVYVPEWWYVIDEGRVLSADIFVIWADVFIMPIMIFLSGYFGLKSMSKDGALLFFKKKCWRIGVPWILGAMLVAPWIAYLMIASRNLPLSFNDFYWQYFWGAAYQHAHYWYLGALMALYILMMLACLVKPSCKYKNGYPRNPSLLFFTVFVILGALGYGTVNYYIPDGVWIHPLYLIVLQPTRVPLYLLYFALGAYAWRNNWFSSSGYKVTSPIWLLAFSVCSAGYLAFVLLLPAMYTFSPLTSLIIKSILWSGLCFTALFGLLALFSGMFNQSTAFWRCISPVSYSMYWAHMIFVLPFNWLVRDWPINSFEKYIIVCIFSLTAIYLTSRYILNQLPFFAGNKSHLKLERNNYTS